VVLKFHDPLYQSRKPFLDPQDFIYMWSDLLREAMKSDTEPTGFSGFIEIKSTGRVETGRNELYELTSH
jgi:hypothetical protein